MSVTRFLSNDSLWSELRERLKAAKSCKVAVAFLGTGGADLLPLKKGDALVVDLGIETVRQGLTSPKEVQRLIRRGVRVFTRSTLHAKFFLCDRVLIVGSANASRNSQRRLDEAASLTTDPVAIRRAAAFFEQLCTEPVRPEYLKVCLRAYRPPKFGGNGTPSASSRQRRVVEAKLWFIGGLRSIETPEHEQDQIAAIEKDAAARLRDPANTEITWSRYLEKPRFLNHIRVGDWVVECVKDDARIRHVHPPAQVLGIPSYARSGGKRVYLLVSEAATAGEPMKLSKFRHRIRHVVPELDKASPRTRPIPSDTEADAILRLWTSSSRISRRRGNR
jgi:hypothetical protein